MKKYIFISLLLIAVTAVVNAQDKREYSFTIEKEAKVTSVKDQARSGTCWAYSSLSFFESELLRLGKGEFDLSEMWVVRHTYPMKAEKYMRMHGHSNLAAGGAFCDVAYVLKNYGIVPEEVYKGLNYGETQNVHNEMDAGILGYTDGVLKSVGRGYLTTAWLNGVHGILDAYLGARPEKFTYNGKEYTPQSFSKELGLNMDDYVSLTSYTHHPFYTSFALEIPDNWLGGMSYNLPLNELKEVTEYALRNGHTVLWGADVSERGFAYRKGIAVMPVTEAAEMQGSDMVHWIGLSEKDRQAAIQNLDYIIPERTITQELRQQGFDNFLTTDDHGMHITGIAKNADGKTFYKVKNSWNTTDSKYEGYFYVSENYYLYKTMNILVHKDALPKTIKNKLGIK